MEGEINFTSTDGVIHLLSTGAVNSTPTGTVLITGTPSQGQTLSADTAAIADDDGLGSFSYQWNADGTAIAGATASTLLLSQEQFGKTITVTASYTDAQGSTESLTSVPTAAVDGTTGLTLASTLNSHGGVTLGHIAQPGFGYGIQVDGGAITPIAFAGGYAGTNNPGNGWSAIAAGRSDLNVELYWQQGSTFAKWNLTPGGQFISGELLSGSSLAFAEQQLGVNLNGDTQTGFTFSDPISTSPTAIRGRTQLATASNSRRAKSCQSPMAMTLMLHPQILVMDGKL